MVLLSGHGYFMWHSYTKAKNMKSENPSGSTLAERYLILGNWPSSKTIDLSQTHDAYPITPRKGQKKEN